MVSTQIITPAVWTETARNVVSPSSFEVSGPPVTVKTNYALSPFGTATLPGYFAYPASSSANDGNVGGVALTNSPAPPPVPGHPASATSLTIPAGAATGGGFVFATGVPAGDHVVSMWVNRRSGATTQMQFAVRGVIGFGAARTFTFDQWVYLEETITITPAQAPAVIGWRSVNVVDPAATNFIVADMQVAPVGQNVPQGALVVSGAKADYDTDLVSAFVGAPEASPSTLTGVGVAGISAVGCFAIRSSQWAKEGRYSLRLIANSPTVNTGYVVLFPDIAAPVARGTAIVTRRQAAPITGSTWTAAIGRFYWNPVPQVFSNAAPNAAGEVELRTYSPAIVPGSTLILPHGGLAGTADVWYDLATVVPGVDYAGPAFSGDTFSTDRKRYRWLDVPGNSISVEEVMTAAEVTAPVYEEVTLASPDDTITFRALPENGGFVYDNQTLQRWYEPAETEPDVDSRPNANGSYGLGQVFTVEHRPIIVGQYYGADSLDAKAARQRLIAMRNEGNPILMTVKDEAGMSTRREVWLVDYAAPFTADFSHFTFDLDLIAPDALRYGEESSDSDGMPTQGSGLVWNLGTAPSGLYFDWGTAGNPGQITLTNSGGAASAPRIEVGGPGSINGGFRITEIETGRELTFSRTLGVADTIIFDSRTQRATLNGGDVTGLMTARQWYSIPKGATRRYQITPLGAVGGAPTITGYVGAAWL